jgi:hypothetical protein
MSEPVPLFAGVEGFSEFRAIVEKRLFKIQIPAK